jgi:hypothetical protein
MSAAAALRLAPTLLIHIQNDSRASKLWLASNLLQSRGNALGQTSKITQGFNKTIIAYLRTPIANDVPDHQLDFHSSSRAFASTRAGRTIALAASGKNSLMPWTMYADMSDGDLAAIYAYFMASEARDNKVVVCD